MIHTPHRAEGADGERRLKWFNSPVTFHEGGLDDISTYPDSNGDVSVWHSLKVSGRY